MFSVLIPVFNHERYVRQAVLSAARSPLVSEVLLLDDGSADGSYEIVRQLSGSLA
jgi:glycosyltransferase involved in cell wall biosynthesis